MAVTIRKKADALRPPAAADDVTSRLRACHTRIRAHLAEAAALAHSSGGGEARRAGAHAVQRYFTVALPLHAADEDITVAAAVGASIAPLIGRLAREHEEIDALVATLSIDWARWSAGDSCPATAGHRVTLERLESLFRGHLELEEAQLFPTIDGLPVETRRAIVTAMSARRE